MKNSEIVVECGGGVRFRMKVEVEDFGKERVWKTTAEERDVTAEASFL